MKQQRLNTNSSRVWPRRPKREVTAAEGTAAAFSILGIVLPSFDQIPSIIGVVIPLVFRSESKDGEISIRRLVTQGVRDAHTRTLRDYIIGFQSTADQIAEQANENHYEQALHRTIGLYDSLNNVRCQFMRTLLRTSRPSPRSTFRLTYYSLMLIRTKITGPRNCRTMPEITPITHYTSLRWVSRSKVLFERRWRTGLDCYPPRSSGISLLAVKSGISSNTVRRLPLSIKAIRMIAGSGATHRILISNGNFLPKGVANLTPAWE